MSYLPVFSSPSSAGFGGAGGWGGLGGWGTPGAGGVGAPEPDGG